MTCLNTLKALTIRPNTQTLKENCDKFSQKGKEE